MREPGRHPLVTLGFWAALSLQLLATGARAQAPGSPEVFPKPKEIAPLVQFWVEVFTQHEADWSVVHDEDHPEIRYETVTTSGMMACQSQALAPVLRK